MMTSEVAERYAKALYESAKDYKSEDAIFAELRILQAAFQKDPTTEKFLVSPLVSPDVKQKVIQRTLEGFQFSELTKNFIGLVAKKDRLAFFNSIVEAYQNYADRAHGVIRGQVRSATALDQNDRSKLEKTVSQWTGKQAILNYREDPTVIGGLIAEVGSFTFDDTLQSHLLRMREDIKRRAH